MDDLTTIARKAMIEHGLQPDFSPEAQRQAESTSQPNSKTPPAIRDLRALLRSSIDNDDTRDLDQLIVAEPLAGNVVKIMVAVADVDALVTHGSAIDDHARSNTTSVYPAAKVFPMLPEKLSTDLTSLREDQERLAVVIEMTISADGQISACDVYRALVLNRAKLTYRAVAAWLDGNATPPPSLSSVTGLDRQLRLQDQAAQALRRIRYERGALNFETVQTKPVFNDGVLTDMRADERNHAKELIEDFMIASNGVVVRYLQSKGRSLLRCRCSNSWAQVNMQSGCRTSPPKVTSAWPSTNTRIQLLPIGASPTSSLNVCSKRRLMDQWPSTPTTNCTSSPLIARRKKRTPIKSSAKSAKPRLHCC